MLLTTKRKSTLRDFMHDNHRTNWLDRTKRRNFFFQNKRGKLVWGDAAIFMSVSGWVEDFIKAFGRLSSAEKETFPSSPVCVSGEAGASHSTKEYLSFQLVRWIKWPSRREGRGKEGRKRVWGRGEGTGESLVEEMCHSEGEQGEGEEWRDAYHLTLGGRIKQ